MNFNFTRNNTNYTTVLRGNQLVAIGLDGAQPMIIWGDVAVLLRSILNVEPDNLANCPSDK